MCIAAQPKPPSRSPSSSGGGSTSTSGEVGSRSSSCRASASARRVPCAPHMSQFCPMASAARRGGARAARAEEKREMAGGAAGGDRRRKGVGRERGWSRCGGGWCEEDGRPAGRLARTVGAEHEDHNVRSELQRTAEHLGGAERARALGEARRARGVELKRPCRGVHLVRLRPHPVHVGLSQWRPLLGPRLEAARRHASRARREAHDAWSGRAVARMRHCEGIRAGVCRATGRARGMRRAPKLRTS